MGALAIPIIMAVASGAGGTIAGKLAQSSASARSPEEQAALGGATGAAGAQAQLGSQLAGVGVPAVQGATNYWQTLLSGNRAQMAMATAGPRAALQDQNQGTMAGIDRSGLRGPVRDLARAQAGRASAQQIAGLTTGVQPTAASNLAGIGTSATGLANSAYGGAGGIYGGLLGSGFQNRVYGRSEGQNAGTAIGSSIFDILSGALTKKPQGTPNFAGSLPMAQWGTS